MRRFGRALLAIPVLLATAWAAAALVFRLPRPDWFAEGTAGVFVLFTLVVLFVVRPYWKALVVWAVAFALVLAWWSTIRPSNDRQWTDDVARPPTGEITGDTLVLHNVRNFDYRSETDYTPHWETRTYDLAKLRGVDLFLSYWGSPAIAHTIVSWDFADGQSLAISIETRKERGESYSAIRCFFREYELYYVVADERDVVRLRTNYRGEDVYLYRIRAKPGVARALLVDYVRRMNAMAEQPEFYNALVDNCTTGIRVHTVHIGAAQPWNWRLLVNGYGDQLLYEQGRIDTSLPFDELKKRSWVVARAKAADQAPDFSVRIRDGLPQPAPVGE